MGLKGTLGVSTRRVGDDIAIAGRDTGTGIPDTVPGHIFDPFFTS